MPPFRGYPDTPSDQKPLLFHMRDFQGLNNQATRSAIDDRQFFWLENLMPIQTGHLRSMYSDALSLYTVVGKTIVACYFYNIGANSFVIVFHSDGTAVQLNTNTAAQVTVTASINTFYIGGYLPTIAQWNSAGIVITAETGPNSYWAWDGTTLFGPGSAAPNWLTNTTPTTMPSGVHGNQIEVYQNRVWITTAPTATIGATIVTSAPSNGADFNPADGANTTPQQDSSLRYQFNGLKQSNGFLYLVGDNNTAAISNVQTGGSPVVTTYANQNLNPQVGSLWQLTVQLFEQALIFVNAQGVYILNGGVVSKISYDLDLLFAAADFSVTPSAAVAIIFGRKCYCFMMKTVDYKNVARNLIFVWDTQKWWVASTLNPNTNLIFTQQSGSSSVAWATDANHLYRIFFAPSISLPKNLQSKLYVGGDRDDGWISFKKQYRFYWNIVDISAQGITFNSTMDSETGTIPFVQASTSTFFEFTNSSNQIIHFQNSSLSTIFWATQASTINGGDVSNYGRQLGVTANVIGGDFSIVAMAIEYTHDVAFLG